MMRRRRGRRQNSNSVSGSEGAQSAAEGSQQASSVAVTHRDVVDALIGVCEEAGMPLGAVGLFLKPMGDGPAAVLDYRGEDRSAPEYPPSIRVDVSGHARDVIRGSIIDAIVEAAHGEQPQSLFGSFVDPEREKRWPELRDRGPQRDGLREKLEAVEVATGGHVAVWFNGLARQLGLVAYDAGVAVGIDGQAAAESGFQVAWYPSMADPDKPLTPSLSIYLGAFGLDEAVMHAIDLILYGYGVEEGTDEHQRLRQHLREATHEYLRRQLASENDPVPVTDPKDMQDLTLQLTPGEATGVAAAAASAGVPQQVFMAAAVLEAVCIRAHKARSELAAVRNDTSPDDADAPSTDELDQAIKDRDDPVFWEGMNRLIGGNGNPAVYSNAPRNLRKHAAYWRGVQLRRALHDRAATLNGEDAPTPLGGPALDAEGLVWTFGDILTQHGD